MASKRPLLTRKRSNRLYKDDATESSLSSLSFHRQCSARSLVSCSSLLSMAKSASTRSMVSSASMDEIEQEICISQLESFCNAHGYQISSDMIFRFAHFHNFDYDDAKCEIAKSAANKYLNIQMDGDLAEQFESRLLFPLPKLRLNNDNSRVVYMRPSQYQQQSPQNEEMMIESLCYVLNDSSKSEGECRDGVSMIINMDEWNVENFNKDSWARVMKVLQGDLVPTKVKTVLIVDAPKGFVSIWNSLRKKLLTKFSKNVHLIKKAKLGGFLMEGFEERMPSDFIDSGKCPGEMVEDYVDLKAYHEE